MDIKALRDFINEHPDGVIIRMIDGAEYTLPHRDYVWFTPAIGRSDERAGRFATAFWLHDTAEDSTRLVNALLVKDVTPLKSNGTHNGNSVS